MADVRLHGVIVGPGGAGWAHAVHLHAKPGSFVTSFDDSLLYSVRNAGLDDEIAIESFGELVAKVARMLGLPERRQATSGQRQALMEAVLARVPKDSWLAGSAGHIGTATTLVERMAELRHAGISAARLVESAAEATDPAHIRRLEALAWVAKEYEAGLAQAGRETLADRIETCLECDVQAQFPCSFRRLLVLVSDGRADVLAERFLQWLAGRGIAVTVARERPRGSLFGRSQSLADRLGLDVPDQLPPAWHDQLFQGTAEEGRPEAALLVAPDILTECEEVVRWCLQAGKDGVLPHRIGIFARDTQSYGPLLLASSQRLGLPLAATISAPLLTSGFARIVLRTLQALGSADVRELGHLASSSYFSEGTGTRSDLWALLRSCHAERPGQGWDSLYDQPQSKTSPWPWLAPLAEWRHDHHDDEVPLAEWTSGLVELVSDCGLAEQLHDDHDGAQRDRNAQLVLQRSLIDRAGHYTRPMAFREFLFLCRRIWETETVVVKFHDPHDSNMGQTVTLFSSTSHLRDFDALAVVGMVEGSLPRRRRNDPVLSDADRAWLREKTGAWLEDSSVAAAAERDEFVRVCASASKQLLFSYPLSDDNRDNVPTLYLDEVRRCLGGLPETQVRRGHYAPRPSLCVSPGDLDLRTWLDDPLPARPVPIVRTPRAQAMVRPGPEEEVRAQEIADAYACPFRSAARHRLQFLSPYSRSGLGALVKVTERACLHTQPDRESAVTAMDAELERLLAELYPRLETWEAALLASAGKRFVRKRAEMEFNLRNSDDIVEQPAQPTKHLTGRFLIDEVRTLYGETVADLGLVNDVPVVRTTSGHAVSDRTWQDDPSIKLRAQLLALSMVSHRRAALVQLDSVSDKRIQFTVGSVGPNRPVNQYLHKVALDDSDSLATARMSLDDWVRGVKASAKDSLATVLAGTMQPRPGLYCGRCRFADLCRSALGNDPDLEAM